MTNGSIIQEPYPPDEDQEGYEAWCEREALLRVVRAVLEYYQGKAVSGGGEPENWAYYAPPMIVEAIEALPEHLRGER